MTRKIHFLTGKRGGWGAMVPTLRAIQQSEALELTVLATDMHVSEEFGLTVDEIKADGFDPYPIIHKNLPRVEELSLIGHSLTRFWAENRPDIVLLIGDRGETLISAVVAQQMGLFIAHIEGGDVTGGLDDSARHAITKLSHLHFAPYQTAAARIQRMGEAPGRIHVVGDVHIDRLMIELEKPLERIEWAEGADIVMVHPDPSRPEDNVGLINTAFGLTEGRKRAFIYPCSDDGADVIMQRLRAASSDETIFKNVPHGTFIMALRQAKRLIGNSSVCRREASYIGGLDVIEIGNRQGNRPKGRVFGEGWAWKDIVRILEVCEIDIGKVWGE